MKLIFGSVFLGFVMELLRVQNHFLIIGVGQLIRNRLQSIDLILYAVWFKG